MRERNQQFNSPRGHSKKPPQHVSGVLEKIVRSLGISKNYNGWLVVSRWPEIAGAAVAREARAISYEDGCLVVAVHDSAWRQELAMRQDELLEKIQSLPYGRSVKQIRLVRGTKGHDKYGDRAR